MFSVCSAQNLNFNEEHKNTNNRVYTIQLFSYIDKNIVQEVFEKIPAEFKAHTNLYKIKGTIKGRCFQASTVIELEPYIEKLHAGGFKDAFIVKTTTLDMQNEIISDKKEEVATKQTKSKNENIKEATQNTQQNTLSQSDKTDILLKAQNSYLNGNESDAIMYYEMLLASDSENEKIKNNLCYLYGKQGAWSHAKDLIEAQNYLGKFIYAYAYGALERNNPNFYYDLSPYILVDHSGRLMILTGYYFEKQNEIEKANYYYQMGYEKNPENIYNIFAYARSLDIKKNTQAITIYKTILNKIATSHPMYGSVKKRVSELGG
jgi:hypothetical protein